MPRLGPFLLTSALALASASPGLAHGSLDRDGAGELNSLLERANLVFRGTVVDVDYAQARSQSSDANERRVEVLPVTFVTYRIDEVLSGEPEGELLTLRFLGGPDGTGRFLEISNTPVFQPKDQDVVFVRSNGEDGCPFVDCADGRFRIHDGGLYNAYGFAVQAIEDRGIIDRGHVAEELRTFRYPALTFEEAMRNPRSVRILEALGFSLEEARKRYEAEAPREIVVERPVIRSEDDVRGETDTNGGRDLRPDPNLDIPLRPDIDGGLRRELDVLPRITTDGRFGGVDLSPPDGVAAPTVLEPRQEAPIAVEQFTETVREIVPELNLRQEPVASISRDNLVLRGWSTAAPQPSTPDLSREDEAGAVESREGNPVLGR